MNPVWSSITSQQGPELYGVDNNANGIIDTDHYDALAAIVNGGAIAAPDLPGNTISTIQNNFATNRNRVQQQELTIPGVQITAFSVVTITTTVTTGGAVTVVGNTIEIPSLWSRNEDAAAGDVGVLAEAGDMFEVALRDLLSAEMTLAPGNSSPETTHIQSFMEVLIRKFIATALPSILSEAGDVTADRSVWDALPAPNVDLDINSSLGSIRVRISSANLNMAITNFKNAFNCTTFVCQDGDGSLAATGNLNADGDSNADSAAAASRQDFLSAIGISNPPLQFLPIPESAVGIRNGLTVLGDDEFAILGGDGTDLHFDWATVTPLDYTHTNPALAGDVTGAVYVYENTPDSAALLHSVQVSDGTWTRTLPAFLLTLMDAPEGEGEGTPEGGDEGEGALEGGEDGEGDIEGGGDGEGAIEGGDEGEGTLDGEGGEEGAVDGEGEPEGVIEGEGDLDGEGTLEGEGSDEGEGAREGEGSADGEGDGEGGEEGEGEGTVPDALVGLWYTSRCQEKITFDPSYAAYYVALQLNSNGTFIFTGGYDDGNEGEWRGKSGTFTVDISGEPLQIHLHYQRQCVQYDQISAEGEHPCLYDGEDMCLWEECEDIDTVVTESFALVDGTLLLSRDGDVANPYLLRQDGDICFEVEGETEGATEGAMEGGVEGGEEGAVEGTEEGALEGSEEGALEGAPEGDEEGVEEGAIEGGEEGDIEGVVEGEEEEGDVEEGEADEEPRFTTADKDGDFRVDLQELLRVIQLYNAGRFHCDESGEDGFNPGAEDPDEEDFTCTAHDSDYNPQDWVIQLSELLRIVQIFNVGGYYTCEDEGRACPGLPG